MSQLVRYWIHKHEGLILGQPWASTFVGHPSAGVQHINMWIPRAC